MLDSSTSSFPFSKEGSWKCICTSNIGYSHSPRLILNYISKFNDTINVILNYMHICGYRGSEILPPKENGLFPFPVKVDKVNIILLCLSHI